MPSPFDCAARNPIFITTKSKSPATRCSIIRRTIWLSRRATQADPWGEVAKKYEMGSKHTGKVVRLQPFGAFIELESGIDGLISSAMGAALAHAAAGGGPAFALLGDLAFLHDAPGLVLGPDEARPDLCLVVVNNDGGGIFSTLEPAAFEGPFERVFGTPHGAGLDYYARGAGLPHLLLERTADLPGALRAAPGGLRVIEARTDRAGQVVVNGGNFNATAPFGGYKQSGIGRELGRFGLEEFLEVKSLQK